MSEPSEPTVRRADHRDVDALLGLIDEVQALHVQQRPETFRPTDAHEVRERVEQLLNDPLVTVFVAELSGVVCGYLVAIVRHHPGGPFTVVREFMELDQVGVKGELAAWLKS